MAEHTGIEWTDATWNPVVGCSVVSPGCTNCYAMRMAARLERMGQPIYQGLTQPSKAGAVWSGRVELSNWGQVIKPLSWRRPRRIFVNSMSDLFHPALPDVARDTVFAVMALAPHHTYQVLTKRADVMRAYMAAPDFYQRVLDAAWPLREAEPALLRVPISNPVYSGFWPQLWLGVSVEDQRRADERIPDLLSTPAATRFLSCEPLLSALDLTRITLLRKEGVGPDVTMNSLRGWYGGAGNDAARIHWIIAGGESGPGARPMHPDWARSLRDQCAAAGVPFFWKQMSKKAPIPADLLVREFPHA